MRLMHAEFVALIVSSCTHVSSYLECLVNGIYIIRYYVWFIAHMPYILECYTIHTCS